MVTQRRTVAHTYYMQDQAPAAICHVHDAGSVIACE